MIHGTRVVEHVELDAAATTLRGWTGSVNRNRQSGVHLVNAALWGASPGFDSGDAGFNFRSDRAGMHVAYQWRETTVTVTRIARERSVAVAKFYTWNFAREVQSDGLFALGHMQFRNYWTLFGTALSFRTAQDDNATRGRPSMLAPAASGGSIALETDGRKRLSLGANLNGNRDEFGGSRLGTGVNVRFRPSASLEVSAGPGFDRNHTVAQYVTTFADPAGTTRSGPGACSARSTRRSSVSRPV